MNTMLNEKDLTFVSGGAGAGKFDPDDPTIKTVAEKLENAKLVLSHFSTADKKLESLLNKALKALKKGTGFNPWTALIHLDAARPLAQQLVQRVKTPEEKERAHFISTIVGEAHYQLRIFLD